MKNILVPTDFSVAAENAAHYAIALAKKLKADVTLCNAYKVPANAPMAAQVAWPLVQESDIERDIGDSPSQLLEKLEVKSCTVDDDFCPQIRFESEKGPVCKVVHKLVERQKSDLVVMGMAGAGQIVQWALGSNSKTMIDEADFPVLYVPYAAKFKPIEKIAFASNLSTDDLKPLLYLCEIAKTMNAEIIVYHITSSEIERIEHEKGIDNESFTHVVSNLGYSKISFENILHSDIHEGFKWIRNNKEIDLIAIVHRQHTLLDKLVNGSYAHKLSRFTQVPLLIFQSSDKLV